MLLDILLMVQELFLKSVSDTSPFRRLGQPVDGVHDQMEPIQIVQDRHIERRGDGPSSL